MYPAHFGLTQRLLAPGIARDARVFTGAGGLGELADRLGVAVTRGDGLVLLSGPAGSGKTTLAAHALRTHGARLAVGWIAHAPSRPHDLLEQLLLEFDIPAEPPGRAGLLQAWQRFLNEMAVAETAVCVLVENADALGADVLRALESLTSAAPNGCPGANIVLMSRTSLSERLRLPGLEGLAQRVNANLRLLPLDAQGTAAYLEFAFAACGGRLEEIVDTDAVHALHVRSDGVIRVVTNLTDTALALAAARGLARLDAALVEEVAAELAGTSQQPALPAEPPLLTDVVDTAELAPAAPAAAAEAAADPEHSAEGVRAADDALASIMDEIASPLAFEDFRHLMSGALFGDADLAALRRTTAA